MNWGQEILRAFILAFGTMEILTNLSYLLRNNGLEFARKQHGEIPENVDNRKIRIKVVAMLITGILFFLSGLMSYILHSYIRSLFIISAVIFSVYAITEALYYKYWKTYGFALISIILLIVCFIL